MFAWIYVNQVWPITDHIRGLGLSHSQLWHIKPQIFNRPTNLLYVNDKHTHTHDLSLLFRFYHPLNLIHSIACTCRQTPLVPFFILANKNTSPLFSRVLHIYHYVRDCNESIQILCQSWSRLNWTYVLVTLTPF